MPESNQERESTKNQGHRSFGSINDEGHTRQDSNTSVPRYYGTSTERTPLLDPDDPAVSPLNLLRVWNFRLFLWILVGFGSIWATILFVNEFVTIPFIVTKTSGFLELDFTILAIISLLLGIFNFTVPSEAQLNIGYFLIGQLAFQLLLTLLIPSLRRYYNVIGIITIAFTLLAVMSSLVLAPIIVKHGKHHEEVRLTGRVETRWTVTEWLKASSTVFLATLLVAVPFTLIFLGFLLDVYDRARLFHGAGEGTNGIFVPIQSTSYGVHTSSYLSYSVYVQCTPENENVAGSNQPVVVIESDDRVSSQAFYKGWLEELHADNKLSRVCLWNRPGRGFSDVAPTPFTLDDATNALTIALTAALLPENATDKGTLSTDGVLFQNHTLALVSHGLGSVYSRAFASKHSSQVQSLTLIDPIHEKLLSRYLGRPSRGFFIWLHGLLSPLSITRQLSWLLHQRGPEERYLGITNSVNDFDQYKLPFKTRSSELKATLQEQILAFNGRMSSQLEQTTKVLSNSNIPLAIITSAQSARTRDHWNDCQRELTKITNNNVAWEILDGPHDVWVAEKAKFELQKLFLNVLKEKHNT
jgi:pimeloyl-ACP methyl ester carboxylesterase